MTKQLMVIKSNFYSIFSKFVLHFSLSQFCLLQGLESLHTCSSSGVVHWYLVLLSRVYLGGESEVAGPVWGVLKKIITELQVI